MMAQTRFVSALSEGVTRAMALHWLGSSVPGHIHFVCRIER